MQKKEQKIIDSPLMAFVATILFLVSLALIIQGLRTSRKNVPMPEITDSQKKDGKEEVSVSEYFDDSVSTNFDAETFLKEDPFKKECQEVSGDGLPSKSSYTVCLR